MSRYVSPVVPVLDLMIGQVVWAKGGSRGNYAPVHSSLTASAQPVDVAKAVFNQTGCDCLYVANIDSFAGATPISEVYRELTEAGFSLWIDADWMSFLNSDERVDQILSLAQDPNIRLVFSSETMSSWNEFSIVAGLAKNGLQPIYSLDVQGGEVIAKSDELTRSNPMEMIRRARDAGVTTIILLDLKSVGTENGGSTEELVRTVSEQYPDLQLISGGGIRSHEDAQKLLTAGCQHVLVASAIYDCKFTPDDVANLTPFRPCSMTAIAMRNNLKPGNRINA